MTEDNEIGARVSESILSEAIQRASFNIDIEIGSDKRYKSREAAPLKIMLYIIAARITPRTDFLLFASLLECDASASETSLVVARLIPDVASVIANE